MRDVFLDLLRVARVDGMNGAEVAIEHHAARILESVSPRVSLGGEFAVAEVVRKSAAILCPVLVERGHGEHIGDVDFVDEFSGLAD